jgi:hypothetical protein
MKDKPCESGVFLFNDEALKACFLKPEENKQEIIARLITLEIKSGAEV